MSVIDLRRATFLCNNCLERSDFTISGDEKLKTGTQIFWDKGRFEAPECDNCMSRDWTVVIVY